PHQGSVLRLRRGAAADRDRVLLGLHPGRLTADVRLLAGGRRPRCAEHAERLPALHAARLPASLIQVGAPKWPPHPQTLVTPRETRGAPRSPTAGPAEDAAGRAVVAAQPQRLALERDHPVALAAHLAQPTVGH